MENENKIEVTWNVVNGTDDKGVKRSLKMIQDNNEEKTKRDNNNKIILDFLAKGFEIHEPLGARIINGKLLFQVLYRMMSQSKMHDFTLHGAMAPYWQEDLMTHMLMTVLGRGGWDDTFRGKAGMSQNLLSLGDAFRMIGTREGTDVGFPIKFTPVDNSNVYFNVKSTAFRSTNKPVTECTIVFSGTWGRFLSLFPDAKAKGAAPGCIPRVLEGTKETSEKLGSQKVEDKIEWAYSWDLENRRFRLYAGSACTVLDEKEYSKKDEKGYIWSYDDGSGRAEDYIPVSHFMCYPSSEGFYNDSPLQYAYDIAKTYAMLMNAMGLHVKNNVFDLTIANIPQGETAKFYQKLTMAQQQLALGRRAIIPNEISASNPNGYSFQSMAVPTVINEAQAMFNELVRALEAIGIYIYGPSSPEETATKTRTNIERSIEGMRQIMEVNASNAKFELDCTLDLTKKTVRNDDQTYMNIPNSVQIDGKFHRPDYLRLGDFKTELESNHWWCDVDARSGVIRPNTLKLIEIESMMARVPPGTPEYASLLKQEAALNNVSFSDESYNRMATQPVVPGQTPTNVAGQAAGNSQPVNQQVGPIGSDALT